MLNSVVLVGKVTEVYSNSVQWKLIKISVERNFRSIDTEEYESDEILVRIRFNLAEVSVGDLIGIKGRVEMNEDEMSIVGEKISILTVDPEQ
jgi:cell shape-determining protein MreC